MEPLWTPFADARERGEFGLARRRAETAPVDPVLPLEAAPEELRVPSSPNQVEAATVDPFSMTPQEVSAWVEANGSPRAPPRRRVAQVDEPEPLRADEPLLEVARQRPADAARFLKAVLLSGGMMGLILLVPVLGFFLSDDWRDCGKCGRPLHIWLVVHCVLHLLQTPLRFSFFWKLQRPTAVATFTNENTIEEKIRRMTLSKAWRLSTWLSTAAYGWFVVGVVWLLNANFCKPCPGLYRLTLGVMAIALAKPLATLGTFRYIFGACLRHHSVVQRPAPKGARKSLVKDLPLIEHSCQCMEDSQVACAVCICDFEDGDILRRLPCGHKFHRPCIDKWLRRSKACPLCMHNVELPAPQNRPPLRDA